MCIELYRASPNPEARDRAASPCSRKVRVVRFAGLTTRQNGPRVPPGSKRNRLGPGLSGSVAPQRLVTPIREGSCGAFYLTKIEVSHASPGRTVSTILRPTPWNVESWRRWVRGRPGRLRFSSGKNLQATFIDVYRLVYRLI